MVEAAIRALPTECSQKSSVHAGVARWATRFQCGQHGNLRTRKATHVGSTFIFCENRYEDTRIEVRNSKYDCLCISNCTEEEALTTESIEFLQLAQIPCGDDKWVPYDSNILPTDNLHDKPDNLDPQPEYPMRTEFAFYKEDPGMENVFDGETVDGEASPQAPGQLAPAGDEHTFPSVTILLLLWVIGLCAWCGTFLGPTGKPSGGKRKRRRRKAPPEDTLPSKDA